MRRLETEVTEPAETPELPQEPPVHMAPHHRHVAAVLIELVHPVEPLPVTEPVEEVQEVINPIGKQHLGAAAITINPVAVTIAQEATEVPVEAQEAVGISEVMGVIDRSLEGHPEVEVVAAEDDAQFFERIKNTKSMEMKRCTTFIVVLLCAFASGQNINDVLRHGLEEVQGTARFQAMGGAFGALGGDLSAINVNPAGSAVFNFGELTVSGSNYNRNNEGLFGGSTRNTELNSIELNQVGGVFVFKSSDSPWKKIALALNYDLVRNYGDELFVSGNTSQGVDNYFLNFAQGEPLDPLRVQEGEFVEDAYLDIGANFGFGTQQAFLGFQAGLIEPTVDDNANTSYFSNAQYLNVDQDYLQSTSGYNGKFTLNFASQYREKIYVGASLNFHSVLYERLTLLDESGYDRTSPVQFTVFDNLFRTEGYGFSLGLGAIARLSDNIRIGGSYRSPTWYEFTDDTSQRINSTLAEPDIDFIDFGIVNLFREYTIRIPSKLTGSFAVIFGKTGLLSFDYSYQDMSQAELRPTTDPSYAVENDFIANTLGTINTYRIGGEFRLNQISLRGGYKYEESPYANSRTIGDLTGYSGGIGYSFGGNRLNLAYSRTERDVDELLFDSGLDSSALVTRINTNVTLGYTLKF